MNRMPGDEGLDRHAAILETGQVRLAAQLGQHAPQLDPTCSWTSVAKARRVHGIQQSRDLAVRHQDEEIDILRETGRAVEVVGDGSAVGPMEAERLEKVLEQTDDLHQRRRGHSSLSANAR